LLSARQASSIGAGEQFDLLIIGGGINGVGIARDAAGRGLSVVLCEQGDLGGATSSASSKLLHGGLRYLERYQFRMVRHALAEREVLLAAAPHIVHPLRFVLPHNPSVRPYWMIRLGMFLYDHLARRATLPGSTGLRLREDAAGAPLKASFERGFEYSDCWVDDARLVILTAIDARQRGALILPRTRCVATERGSSSWQVELEDVLNGKRHTVEARALVNAAGPWAEPVAREILGLQPRYRSQLVKGSHIVVPRLYDDQERAYILQNDDRRVVFVLPFENDFTLIGTTDIPFNGDPSSATIDDDECRYLCAVVSDHFKQPVSPSDVVWSFSGVRPLFDDGSRSPSRASRDYVIERHPPEGSAHAAALTIWGGKLTGFRLLAEAALDGLKDAFPNLPPPWTSTAPLPGGKLHPPGIERFARMLTQVYPWLPPELAVAYSRRYGGQVHTMLGNAASLDDLGPALTPGLYEREVTYLMRHEWAQSPADVLWRRTSLGLRASQIDEDRLRRFMQDAALSRE
jgi:glycerol-3-phosphate dehydrogenase